MITRKNPRWWSPEYDSAWDRVRDAFQRDLEQTKHDLGSKHAPDLKQSAAATVTQAAGREPTPPPQVPNFDQDEPAYRFGYGARTHYGSRYPLWSDELERELSTEWGDDWDRVRPSVLRGWSYRPSTETRKAS